MLRDRPFPGPCDPDPATHRERRRAYLRACLDHDAGGDPQGYRDHLCLIAAELLDAQELAAKLASYLPGRPVVLWAASSWPDRLVFCWLFDTHQRAGRRAWP